MASTRRYGTSMCRPACVLLSVIVLLPVVGCRSARLHAVNDGQTTWRSDAVPIMRDGGIVTVHVGYGHDEEVTVVLVDAVQMNELDNVRDARAITAARGRARDGDFVVRFTGLPPGTYHAHAFRDVDGDGCHSSHPPPFESEYMEPHSGFERIDVTAGSRHEIELRIREEQP